MEQAHFRELTIPFSLIGLQGPIALDPTGNVYVAVTGETSTGKVLVFDGVGHPVRQWNIVDQYGEGYSPMGIAIDSTGNVYMSVMQMSGTNPVGRILKFDQERSSRFPVGSREYC